MAGDRLARILTLMSQGSDGHAGTRGLCAVAAEVTAMSGAGIMLVSDDVPQGSLCATNSVAELIEDLQYTLGEGPCVDAYRDGRATVEPNLAAAGSTRWRGFTPPAVHAGVRAVFGFPVRIGAARLGALNLYRDRSGPLSDDQHGDALVIADVAARAVLAAQANAPAGEVAAEIDAEANFHPAVHQAAGMVSAQLDVSVGEALLRMRARAFASERLVADVAHDVVGRRLRFDEPSVGGTGREDDATDDRWNKP